MNIGLVSAATSGRDTIGIRKLDLGESGCSDWGTSKRFSVCLGSKPICWAFAETAATAASSKNTSNKACGRHRGLFRGPEQQNGTRRGTDQTSSYTISKDFCGERITES